MENFAILRANKIKNLGSFTHLKKHDFRLSEVPNANLNIANDYQNFTTKSAEEKWEEFFGAGGKFEKRRADNVLLIDYLVTASPNFFETATKDEIEEFFEKSLNFLKQKHGENNVIYSVIHNDESTPHMHIKVVPEHDGKLNCKHFLGGAAKLKRLQTDFAKEVEHLGLKRGAENSHAKHQTIKSFYKGVNKTKSDFLDDKKRYKFKLLDERNFLNLQTTHTKNHNQSVLKRVEKLYLNYKIEIKNNENLKQKNADLEAKTKEFDALKTEIKALKKYKNIAITAQKKIIEQGIKNDKRNNQKHNGRIAESREFGSGYGPGRQGIFVGDSIGIGKIVSENTLNGYARYFDRAVEVCQRIEHTKDFEGLTKTISGISRAITNFRTRTKFIVGRNIENTRNLYQLSERTQKLIMADVKKYWSENASLIQQNKKLIQQKKRYFAEINDIKRSEKLTAEQKKKIGEYFKKIKEVNEKIVPLPPKNANVLYHEEFKKFVKEEEAKAAKKLKI